MLAGSHPLKMRLSGNRLLCCHRWYLREIGHLLALVSKLSWSERDDGSWGIPEWLILDICLSLAFLQKRLFVYYLIFSFNMSLIFSIQFKLPMLRILNKFLSKQFHTRDSLQHYHTNNHLEIP